MDNIEQLIDVAVANAIAPVEPAVDPAANIPPGCVAVPYVEPGILTHTYRHDIVPLTWHVTNPTTVEKASWRCKNPSVREWTEVLQHTDCTCLHVCDNDASRVEASRVLNRACTGTYDHTRTRDQIILHKKGNWVASPEPIGDATIRVLNFGKANVVTMACDKHIGTMVSKLKRGMGIVVRLGDDMSNCADICFSMRRCFETAYVYAGWHIYIVGVDRNTSPWHMGNISLNTCAVIDEIVQKVVAERSATRDLISKINATAIHGVVDADLLDRVWPPL